MKIASKSANVFFLMTNQNTANPPKPTTTVEPITIPAIAPPLNPFLAGVSVEAGSSGVTGLSGVTGAGKSFH